MLIFSPRDRDASAPSRLVAPPSGLSNTGAVMLIFSPSGCNSTGAVICIFCLPRLAPEM